MATTSPVTLSTRPVTWSHDQDVFRLDPSIYSGCESILAAGADGGLSATTFTSPSADFTLAGIRSGDVIEVRSAGTAGWQRGTLLLRVVDVNSATSLSVGRIETTAGPGAPFAAEVNRPWQIRTMDHWRRLAWREIAVHRLHLDDPLHPLTPGDVGDDGDNVWRAEDLAECEALLALAKFHDSRWNGTSDHTAHAKAAAFLRQFESLFARIQVLLSQGTQEAGDGPIMRLTPGSSRLRRD